MKKIFFTLCALCLCGTMWGQDTQYDETTGLWYTVEDEAATIVAVPEGESTTYTVSNLTRVEEGKYSIPETVAGYTVTAVGANAFEGALVETESLIHLVIPANINYLNYRSFYGCTQIEEVTVEYSETALHQNDSSGAGQCFVNCSNLKTVNLDRNIEHGRNSNNQYVYMAHTFSGIPSITTVFIGEHVTTLTHNAFNANSNDSQLANVYCYTTTVPEINLQCFKYQSSNGCTLNVYDELVTSFQEDHRNNSTYNIDYGWGDVFETNSILGMGSANPELVEGTFKDVNTGLYCEINEDGETVSIYLDEEIGGSYTDENLVQHETITGAYTLPATVQAEEGGTEYVVNRVEAEAFKGAKIEGHLVIPTNILNMGESAFENCTGLSEVTYEYSSTALIEENQQNSNGAGCSFYGCSSVTTVNLYRNLSQTGSYQFRSPFCCNTSVETLNIGPHVTTILPYMFRNTTNSSLKTINCYSVNPPTLSTYDPFANLNSEYVINVPFGAESLYTDASSSWATYATDGHIAEMSNAFAITTNNGEDAAYATFYNSASAVEFFNAEATVYAATSVNIEDETGNVYIESLGSVVPAETAVLVETSEAQTMLAIATTEGATAPTTNYLYGFDTATTITTPVDCVYYMLTYGTDGSLGFYWGATDGGAFDSAAHKAYLAIPNGIANNTSGISIKKDADNDTTGISSVEASEGAKVSGIYTIQGVRVSNMNQPGLYIVDGKKVMKR